MTDVCGSACETGPAPIYLGLSRGTCRQCGSAARKLVDVRYISDGEGVYLERLCPEHGTSRTLVAESLSWYLEAIRAPIAARPPEQVVSRKSEGCPGSCGPCTTIFAKKWAGSRWITMRKID